MFINSSSSSLLRQEPPASERIVRRIILLLLLAVAFISTTLVKKTDGLGYMGSIAASYGEAGVVCAIEASGGQQVLCWGRSSSSESQQQQQLVTFSTSMPEPFVGLSGGGGFMCGLQALSLRPFCWQGNNTDQNIIPQVTQSYDSLAAGGDHVCGITPSGWIDCWSLFGSILHTPPNVSPLQSIVAGRNFTCGVSKQSGTAVCWGENDLQAPNVVNPPSGIRFESLAAGTNHVCGIVMDEKNAVCWGDNSSGQASPPPGVPFAALTAGFSHTCGILSTNHEVLCWGDAININRTAVPLGTEFLAIAASSDVTCGVRESNLLAVCWGPSAADYQPPLQLFNPGVCESRECTQGLEFAFNLSVIDSTLLSVCVNSSQRICAPCASTCPAGTFLSSPCSTDADRVCRDCSLCQQLLCQSVCQESLLPTEASIWTANHKTLRMKRTEVIITAATVGGFLVASLCGLVLCHRYKRTLSKLPEYVVFICACMDKNRGEKSSLMIGSCAASISSHTRILSQEKNIRMQVFRLSELRDATSGFKEVAELGRGSYGFVYKAVLPDGRQLAVKRVNAAHRIHCNSRGFEADLEVLCKVRHPQLVNLVGYCQEFGERLLIYEFMPNGTLHDHLHGGLSQLNWGMRFKVAMQAAQGIKYLHKDASPPVIHCDIKSSNILLDAEWNARVADFGLLHSSLLLTVTGQLASPDVSVPEDQIHQHEIRSPRHHMNQLRSYYMDPNAQSFNEKTDVFSFGVVLLEILSGRKVFDADNNPPNIVQWAVPKIVQGKTLGILDKNLGIPKAVEPLLRMAEIAELCVRSVADDRPSISDVALWLGLVSRGSFL